MRISSLRCSPKSFLSLVSLVLLASICGSVSTVRAANPNKAPVLISDSASTRAIALESVTFVTRLSTLLLLGLWQFSN